MGQVYEFAKELDMDMATDVGMATTIARNVALHGQTNRGVLRKMLEMDNVTREMKRGSEHWFGIEVGLPRSGIDPERDTSHVSDNDLIELFGPRVRNFGYLYRKAKVRKVILRVIELYPSIYQNNAIPADYITESFARAVTSEVCRMIPMNWARFAEGVWSRKKGERSEEDPVVYFRPEATPKSFDQVILERLKGNLNLLGEECEQIGTELEHIRVAQREWSEPSLERIDKNAQMESHILMLKLNIEMAMSNKQFAEEFKELMRKHPLPGKSVQLYESMEAKEIETEKENRELLKAVEAEQDLDKARREEWIQMESTTNADLDRVKCKRDAIADQIQQIKKWAAHTHVLRPNRFLPNGDFAEEGEVPIILKSCALCRLPFPLLDAILAPCYCFYHPYCVVMQNCISEVCAGENCNAQFSEGWQKSHGLFYLQGMIKSCRLCHIRFV
jgi:hypothetical protein